jgi:hypothetical protein
VDYTRSVAEVSRDATRVTILREGSLNIFQYIDGRAPDERHEERREYCSWVYQLKYRSMRDRFFFISHTRCANRPIYVEGAIPSQDDELLFLRGYDVSRISIVITTETFHRGRNEELLGRMMNEAIQHLMASGQVQLIQQVIYAIIGGREISMPNIQSKTDWLSFASRFVEYCFTKQVVNADVVTSELSSAKIDKFDSYLETMFDSAIQRCGGRRFFLTTDGRVGLGNDSLEKNDCVATLFGGDYPFLLRPTVKRLPPRTPSTRWTRSEDETDCYRFVGLAYIPEIMYGDPVYAFEKAGIGPKTFCLW